MKKLALILVLTIIPLVALYSQDDKKTEKTTTHKTYTIEWKDVTCPDCQGWGWLLGEGFKNSTPASMSGNGSNNPSNQRGVSNTGVDKYRCMNCNGSGEIKVKYYKQTL